MTGFNSSEEESGEITWDAFCLTVLSLCNKRTAKTLSPLYTEFKLIGIKGETQQPILLMRLS